MFENTTNPVPITVTDPAVRRRNEPVVLTNRHCEKRVAKRTKIYDRKASGLYVSITTAGVATFYLQITDRFSGRARCKRLGVYNPTTFNTDDARASAYALRARMCAGENVFEEDRRQKELKAKQSLTVDDLIALRIDWMKTDEKKADGEKRPRIESWENVASHLRRLVSPKLGKKCAVDLTRDDIAALSNDIVDGKHGVASVSNARHMRRAVSGMYNWAAEAGRSYVPVTCQPTLKLPKLPQEHPRNRVLTEDEIRILWRGLDRGDLPWNQRTRLALKLELVTMLRGGELIGAHRDELFDLDGEYPRFDVPLKRVKKRRVIQQPLSSLAVEIIKDALADSGGDLVFAGRFGDEAPLQRKATSTALRGTKNPDGSVRTPGICSLLKLEPFTPHDLRRTAATLAADLNFDDAWIARCLDHAAGKNTEVKVPSVTGNVYIQSKRMRQKRAVLDGIAAALREIVGVPVKMRVAA